MSARINMKKRVGRIHHIHIYMFFCIFIWVFAMIACDGDDSSGTTLPDTGEADMETMAVISGKAVLCPVDGAEIKLFHFGDDGSEIEVIAANAPVVTSSSGAYEFEMSLEDVEDMDTPLLLKSTGGIMDGQPAPELEALIPDSDELAFADGGITLYLSAASSVAARMLKNKIDATGSAPSMEDAETCIEKVEKALNVDLSRDPSYALQDVAMNKRNTRRDLNLFNTPDNITVVRKYIDHAAVLLDSSSDVPYDFGNGFLMAMHSRRSLCFERLRLRVYKETILANNTDTARIFISVRDFFGRRIEDADEVRLSIVSGAGSLSDANPTLNKGYAKVLFTSETPGKVEILVEYDSKCSGKTITKSTVINVVGDGENNAPVADAGENQTVSTGSVVTLDGSDSSDPDGDALSYAWTISEAPQGSAATLSDATVADPTFTADMDGAYAIQLVVNDGAVDSSPATVTITAATGNSAPTADAGSDQEVETGTTVMLDGNGSSDPDGNSLTYAWTILEAPQGSNAVLSDPSTSETVFFTPDVEGTYTIQLVVNDGAVDSDPDTAIITATASGPDGEALYVQYCKNCHGANGDNNGDLSDMTADQLMSLLPHFGVSSDDIGGQEGAQAISDYISH